ncbi:MAG TPA: diguanylate cyclase [Candidatus Acidoferrales bacterium]|nr:diguanylate cyclase [Candidatus Acidoferrales bacterium]
MEDFINEASLVDSVTGMLNERAFWPLLEESLSICRQRNWPLSLLLIALPEETGEQVAEVARAIEQSVRQARDGCCRLSECLFAVILPGAGDSVASVVAARLRAKIRALGVSPRIASSTTSALPDDNAASELFDRAEAVLEAVRQRSSS